MKMKLNAKECLNLSHMMKLKRMPKQEMVDSALLGKFKT